MLKAKRSSRILLIPLTLILASMACGVFSSPSETPPLPPAEATQALPEEPAGAESTTGPSSDHTQTDPTGETAPQTAIETDPPSDLDDMFEPMWQTRRLLHRYFVDQPVDDAVLAQGALDGLLTYTTIADVDVPEEVARDFAEAAETPDEVGDLFLPFWQAWVAAEGDHDVFLMRAALNGLIDSLGDQHTSYMDPDQFVQANIPIDGSYEGIGAWVDPDAEYLTIVSPMPGSPAEAAGLKSGDQIIKVDGEDMTGIDGNLVIRRVLGPAGSEVTLTIRREGVEDFDVVIVRDRIVIPSVTGEIIEESNIAYVQLFTFGNTTGDDLHNLLEELLAQNPKGLIFDLRNNGGGLLNTAIEVASEFISDGVIMVEIYGDGTRDIYDAIPGGAATEIPMVVLINEGSASASEIVAGALQDYGRATLVGVTSFGKGSVQNWLPLSDNGAVRITIARWFTPNDRLIHEVGLTPDIVVELSEDDVAADRDPQLDKAIEILTEN